MGLLALAFLFLPVELLLADPVPAPDAGAVIAPELRALRSDLDSMVIETWNVGQGLSNSTIFALHQASDGYLWIGTAGGVFRFDGLDFVRFDRRNTPGFPSNRVTALTSTDGGTIWVALLNGGVHRYSQGVWTHYSIDAVEPGGHQRGLAASPDGQVFVSSGSRFLTFDGEGFVPVGGTANCPSEGLIAIGEGVDGEIWWVARDALHLYRNGRCTKSFPFRGAEIARARGDGDRLAYPLIATRNGELWVGSSHGIFRWTRESPTPERFLHGREILALYEDQDGQIWVGLNQGLARFDGRGFPQVATEDGLSDSRVFALMEDRQRGLWLGTYDGLQRLQKGEIRTLDPAPALDDPFTLSVAEHRPGEIWISGHGGVAIHEGDELRAVPMAQSVLEDGGGRLLRIWSSFEREDGLMLFGSNFGLLALEDGRIGSWGPPELRMVAVRTLSSTQEGGLWVGTSRGAYLLEGESVARHVLPDRTLTAFVEDRQGRLYAGTQSGLFRIDSETTPRLSGKTNTGNVYVRTLHEDDEGGLWIGTLGHGLQYFDGEDFFEIGTTQGLHDDNVWHILDDLRGRFWMCSDLGIFSVRRSDLLAFVEGRRNRVDDRQNRVGGRPNRVGGRQDRVGDRQNRVGDRPNRVDDRQNRVDDRQNRVETDVYGLADGMKDLECNGGGHPSAFRATDGRLWFPTAAGPAIVEPAHLARRSLDFPPRVDTIRVDDRAVELGRRLDLPGRARTLELRYSAPSLRWARELRFRYRLEGYDPDWRPVTRQRTAVYGRLPPGDYRFLLEASGSDGTWRAATHAPEIRVPTPPWLTPWALAAYALAILFALGHFVRVQHRRVEEERRIVDQQMKVLQGLLPICSHCKSIRDEEGQWNQLESYIDRHSEAVFSHGICPNCESDLIGELTPPPSRRRARRRD